MNRIEKISLTFFILCAILASDPAVYKAGQLFCAILMAIAAGIFIASGDTK